MRSRHLPCEGPEIAQPWKFHSLAVAVSSKIHGLGAVGGATGLPVFASSAFAFTSPELAGLVADGGSFFDAAGGSVFATAGASASGSPLRKNSASLPSIRLTKTRNDLLSGPTATSSGVPLTRSITGDCFTSASHG